MYTGVALVLRRTLRSKQGDREGSKERSLEISTSPSLAIVRLSQEQVRNLGSIQPTFSAQVLGFIYFLELVFMTLFGLVGLL